MGEAKSLRMTTMRTSYDRPGTTASIAPLVRSTMTSEEYILRFLLFKNPELRHSREKIRRGLRAWVYGLERIHFAKSGMDEEASAAADRSFPS